MSEQKLGVVAETHLSVGDGGLTLKVLDERGPTLELRTSHYGNLPMTIKVFTNVRGLTALRDTLNKAMGHTYQTSEYVYPARAIDVIDVYPPREVGDTASGTSKFTLAMSFCNMPKSRASLIISLPDLLYADGAEAARVASDTEETVTLLAAFERVVADRKALERIRQFP